MLNLSQRLILGCVLLAGVTIGLAAAAHRAEDPQTSYDFAIELKSGKKSSEESASIASMTLTVPPEEAFGSMCSIKPGAMAVRPSGKDQVRL